LVLILSKITKILSRIFLKEIKEGIYVIKKSCWLMIIIMGLFFLIFQVEVMGENLGYNEDQEGSVYFYGTGSIKLSLGSVTVW
jgi:heme/copper-type cytochrome/quinol oxidase subunit 3